ncbi:MAG: dethiobiotin synthase [Sphingomonadaceae bacterium]
MSAFVVTGTDTDIGKSVFCAALVKAIGASYWKPVQAGLEDGGDSARIRELSGLRDDRIVPEVWRLSTPCSPHLAARLDDVTIVPDALAIPSARPLVIEGAGGALVPLTEDYVFADLFARWGLPVIIVARTTLGTINHTLLTIEALRARNCSIHGVAFVGEVNSDSEQIITRMGRVRCLGRLPWLAPLTGEALSDAFASHFDIRDFV